VAARELAKGVVGREAYLLAETGLHRAITDDWTMLCYRVSLFKSKPVFPDGAKASSALQEPGMSSGQIDCHNFLNFL